MPFCAVLNVFFMCATSSAFWPLGNAKSLILQALYTNLSGGMFSTFKNEMKKMKFSNFMVS